LAGEGGGGGDGAERSIGNSGTTTRAPASSKKTQGLSRKARGSLRALELTLENLDREAKKDDLQSLTSNIRKITGLRIAIDTMFDELEDTKHRNDPNKIYEKLKKWSQLKVNKKRAYFARNLLRAIAAERQFGRALEAMDRYNKAKKAGKEIEAIDHQIDYERARAEFHERARRIPPKLRNHLFDPLPKEVPLIN